MKKHVLKKKKVFPSFLAGAVTDIDRQVSTGFREGSLRLALLNRYRAIVPTGLLPLKRGPIHVKKVCSAHALQQSDVSCLSWSCIVVHFHFGSYWKRLQQARASVHFVLHLISFLWPFLLLSSSPHLSYVIPVSPYAEWLLSVAMCHHTDIQTSFRHLGSVFITEVALDSWDLSHSREKFEHLTLILNCIIVINTSLKLSTFIRCSLTVFSGDSSISVISTLPKTQLNWGKTMQFVHSMKQFSQDHTGFQNLYHLSSCNKTVGLQNGVIITLLSKQSNEKCANVWLSHELHDPEVIILWQKSPFWKGKGLHALTSTSTNLSYLFSTTEAWCHRSFVPINIPGIRLLTSLPFMEFSKYSLSCAIFQRHNSKKTCAILQGWAKCISSALCLRWKETRQLNKEVWGPFYGIVCDRKRQSGNCHWCVISFSNLAQKISLHPRMLVFYKACRHISLQ